MSVLLAPLLAQVLTLGVAERTDARYLTPAVRNVVPFAYHYEAAARPSARLQLTSKRFNLMLGYAASFTTVGLESPQRELVVYQAGFLTTSYQVRLSRTTLTLSNTASISLVDFTQQALSGSFGAVPGGNAPGGFGAQPVPGGAPAAPPPGGTTTNTPGTGTTNPPTTGTGGNPTTPPMSGNPTGAPQAYGNPTDKVLYGSWAVNLTLAHPVNRRFTLMALAGYNMAGALNPGAFDPSVRTYYQLTRGAIVGGAATYVYPLSGRDSLVTSVAVQQAWSSFSQATSAQANESWVHRFNRRTISTLGAGVGVTRTPIFEEYHAYSVFPTFVASLSHENRIARGIFTSNIGAYSAPVLDPLRGTVDPRVGGMASVGWTRDRFFARLVGNAALSLAQRRTGGLAQTNAGALNAVSAASIVGYRLTKWLYADATAAVAQQTYYQAQNQTSSVPLVYAVMLGLTAGFVTPIWRN
jgi:hypothetical protein